VGRAPLGYDAQLSQHRAYRLCHAGHVGAYSVTEPKHRVTHELSGAVVGGVAAAGDPEHRYLQVGELARRGQNVGRIAMATQGYDGRVLDQE
jgi:hypothetical protein